MFFKPTDEKIASLDIFVFKTNFRHKQKHMYGTLQQIHSYWAYAVFILLLIAIVNSFVGRNSGRAFGSMDRKFGLYALIASHLQFVFGIILLFMSPYWTSLMENGMGSTMKNSVTRLYVMEHPLINLIAIILITIGWSRHKKALTSRGKFSQMAFFYLPALLLLLTRIPWKAWFS